MLTVAAVSTFLTGKWGLRQLKQRQDFIQEIQESTFLIGYFQPGGMKMEGNFTGCGGKCGMRRFDVQAQPGDGAAAKPVRGGMFQGISVGMQLAAVERNLGGFRFGGLEVHYAMGAILEINHSVELASQEAGYRMTRERNGN